MIREKKKETCEETYTLKQVQTVVLCVSQGILGIGREKFKKQIEELPDPLKNTVLAACLAAKEVQKELSNDLLKTLQKISEEKSE